MKGLIAKPLTRHIRTTPETEDGSDLPEGRKIIVAIGIDEYPHQAPLANPVADAQAVLELFKECGFVELPDAPSLMRKTATKEAIESLVVDQLANALTPDDSLVLFYAGHGDKVETLVPNAAEPGKTATRRTGFLIPVNGEKEKRATWIQLDAWLDNIAGLPARHILVILDACNSGIALADKFRVKGRPEPAAVADLRRRPSRRVIASAMHDEQAVDAGSGSGHSLFAEALIRAIRDRQADPDDDGLIKSYDLFSFVQDWVSEGAKRLWHRRQTPDYGYLAGDGSGDLVISLREGTFSRLADQALDAMLRHDVQRMDRLVTEIVAANADRPLALYLLFRLRFMQGDMAGAAELLSRLRKSSYQPGSVPLTPADLEALQMQLEYWAPVLLIPAGDPPVAVRMLVGAGTENLAPAPRTPFPAGEAYEVENQATAQFEAQNLSDAPAHLYAVTILPHGGLQVGPLLESDEARFDGLAPGKTKPGPRFRVRGAPGGVTEVRILYSPQRLSAMLFPATTETRALHKLSAEQVAQLQMLPVWYRVTGVADSSENGTEPSTADLVRWYRHISGVKEPE